MRRLAAAACFAAALNLVFYTVARLCGVDFVLSASGGQAIHVEPLGVVLMTLVGWAAGTLLLWRVAIRQPQRVSAIAWSGLAVGLGTAIMPLSMSGPVDARVVLAGLHVLSGVVWWGSLRTPFHP